jgi:hypothetical protein
MVNSRHEWGFGMMMTWFGRLMLVLVVGLISACQAANSPSEWPIYGPGAMLDPVAPHAAPIGRAGVQVAADSARP